MLIKCKMCGGDLTVIEGSTVCECEYCGSRQTLPKLNADSDRKANLFDRASHFRRAYDYDKAMGIYEQILNEDGADAEAYWGIVLCRYGIEYVEDPTSGKRVPTINRVQYTSILADEDYKAALNHADSLQRPIYEEEAAYIDSVQKGILEISRNEKPYDVFICYKETDENGQRTHDSQDAQDIYYGLTEQGYKVFFSRITLEDKLGREYEPYIFAALNSAKVMLVIGSKAEYFNAVWVKNEWSRYLALMKNDRNRLLIPCYKGMDPYELPDALSGLQSQNMGKIGFMQDLLRGVKKVLDADKKPEQQPQVIVQNSTSAEVTALLDRAFMALEDGEFAKADGFCEQALNKDAKNARAYLGKLMAEVKVRKEIDLQHHDKSIRQYGNYEKALRFADEKLKAWLTEAAEANARYVKEIQLKERYDQAVNELRAANTMEALQGVRSKLSALSGYSDAAEKLKVCDAKIAELKEKQKKDRYDQTIRELSGANTPNDVRAIRSKVASLERFQDVADALAACDEKLELVCSRDYAAAVALMESGEYGQADAAFRALGDYRDTKLLAQQCHDLEVRRQEEIKAANAERFAREEAERKEKERVAAELKAREAEAKAAKAKKIGIIVGLAMILCVIAAFVVVKIVLPAINYYTAMSYLQDGNTEMAYIFFVKLGDYKDSQQQAAEINKYAGYRVMSSTCNGETVTYAYDGKGNLSSHGNALLEYEYYPSGNPSVCYIGDHKLTFYDVDGAGAIFDPNASFSGQEYIYVTTGPCLGYFRFVGVKKEEYANGDWNEYNEDGTTSRWYRTSTGNTIQASYKYDSQGRPIEATTTYDGRRELYEYDTNGNMVKYTYDQHSTPISLKYDPFGSLSSRTTSNHDWIYNNRYVGGVHTGLHSFQYSWMSNKKWKHEPVVYFSVEWIVYAESSQAYADSLYDAGDYAGAYDIYATLGEAYQTHTADYVAMYAAATQNLTDGKFDDAATGFAALGNYSDAAAKVMETAYQKAASLAASGDYDGASAIYASLDSYSDSANLNTQAKADALYTVGNYAGAYDIYATLGEAYQTHAADYAAMYTAAAQNLTDGKFDDAAAGFVALGKYSDASDQAAAIPRKKADVLYAAAQYNDAAAAYAAISETELAKASTYAYAQQQADAGEYTAASVAWLSIPDYSDSREKNYQLGVSLKDSDPAAACTILSADIAFDGAQEAVYQIAVDAANAQNYELAVSAYTAVGAYKDSAMKLQMTTYAWAGQLFDNAEYDRAAEVYASMGEFSDAPEKVKVSKYAAAEVAMTSGAYDDAAVRFDALAEFKDSADRATAARYAAAKALLDAGNYADARARFVKLGEYSDSATQINECDFRTAAALQEAGNYADAAAAFAALGNYTSGMDASAGRAKQCRYAQASEAQTNGSYDEAIGLYTALGEYSDSQQHLCECHYAKAQQLEIQTDYENAHTEYVLAGEYSDAVTKAQEMAYQMGMKVMQNNDYAGSTAWFPRAFGYADAEAQLITIGEYYFATAQYDAAEKVFDLVPGSPSARQHLYKMGQIYEADGNIEHAAIVYRKAGEYQDAALKADENENEVVYRSANKLYGAKKWEDARSVYLTIPGYKDSDSKLAECDKAIAAAIAARKAELATVGNVVTFGRYMQDYREKKAIQWQVLDVDGNHVLVISKYTLDLQYYNEKRVATSWETCTLRAWLNDTFMNEAFSANEQVSILTTTIDNSSRQGFNTPGSGVNTKDKVFLLSYAEACQYFDSADNREVANVRAISSSRYANTWWLRTTAASGRTWVDYIKSDGYCHYDNSYTAKRGVRPAMWINLDSGIFKTYISTGVWE